MDEIEIETDKYMYEKEYVDDLENGNRTYGENITYVAISPDGSIVATFNPCKLLYYAVNPIFILEKKNMKINSSKFNLIFQMALPYQLQN